MTMAVLVMLIGIVVFGSVIGLLSNVMFNSPNRQRRLDISLQNLLKDTEEFLYLYRYDGVMQRMHIERVSTRCRSIPDELCNKVKQFIRNRHFESTAAQDMVRVMLA